jgi:hypothetical protein
MFSSTGKKLLFHRAGGTELIVDHRRQRLSGDLVAARERGSRRDDRCAVGLADENVLGRVAQTGDGGFRQAPRVAHHAGSHAAHRAGNSEVLGIVVREGDDEFRGAVADVFDRVQVAARDEEHFALVDRECVVKVPVAEDRDERAAGEAVGELVRVGMPVRFAKGVRLEAQLVEREVLEDRKVRPVHECATAGCVGELRGGAADREDVRRLAHGWM